MGLNVAPMEGMLCLSPIRREDSVVADYVNRPLDSKVSKVVSDFIQKARTNQYRIAASGMGHNRRQVLVLHRFAS